MNPAVVVAIAVSAATGAILALWLSHYQDDYTRRQSREEEVAAQARQGASEEGQKKGRAEALATLVETDENSAIIEALGLNVLRLKLVKRITTKQAMDTARQAMENASVSVGLYSYSGQYGFGLFLGNEWVWDDERFLRAGVSTTAPTPQEAYRNFKNRLPRVISICAQLDAVEKERTDAQVENGQ